MGHNLSTFDSPATDLKPGTYRIVNIATKTVVEALDNDRRKVVSWAPSTELDKHQMWFVQRAGRGYQFKNCHFGTYFGVPDTNLDTNICASGYPMTWVLHLIQGEDTFVLQLPGKDRIMNLHGGSTENGTRINITATDDLPDRRRWKFEYITDESDTFDATESLRQELESLKQEQQSLKQELQLHKEEIQRLQHSNMKVPDEGVATRSLQNNQTVF
ncbi:hypothetical protein BDV93DRAFT_603641 [Ceratobasidium sp. AG-I]|nr:hypothetical protein BDV93DRAFT_603641 [Ceratobasidium sp. AG-I]